jgi:holliday junction DNA helicase RuvB
MRLEVAQTMVAHLVAVSNAEQRPLDNILLYGSQGLAKKVLAYVHEKMQLRSRVVSASSLVRPGDLAAILTNLKVGNILYIDELHLLDEAMVGVLYSAANRNTFDFVIGRGHAAKSVRLNVDPFTLIASTTQIAHLPRELLWLFSAQFRLDNQ